MCGLHDTVCMNGPSTLTQRVLAKESPSTHVLPLRPEKINPLLHRLAQPVFSKTETTVDGQVQLTDLIF